MNSCHNTIRQVFSLLLLLNALISHSRAFSPTATLFSRDTPRPHYQRTNSVGGGSVALSSTPKTSESDQRKPWEFFRFVRQSSKFIDVLPRKTFKKVVQPGDVLWTPIDTNKDFDFSSLDDVVMGGASSSTFNGATGKWMGQVTDANNGGFIGIRSTPVVDLDMSQCQGIEVKLSALPTDPSTKRNSNGNNKNRKLRLKVVVRDSTEFNGIGWTTSKTVNGRSFKIPFDRQAPTKYAKTVESDPFQKDQVKSIQFVYSKFEYDGALNPTFVTGDFSLQLEEIRAY